MRPVLESNLSRAHACWLTPGKLPNLSELDLPLNRQASWHLPLRVGGGISESFKVLTTVTQT